MDLLHLEQVQLKKHKGQVRSIKETGRETEKGRAADIAVAHPSANFNTDLPAILMTVFSK